MLKFRIRLHFMFSQDRVVENNHTTINNVSDELTLIQQEIEHVNKNPTVQFFTEISRNTQSKSFTLSLTECVWELRNNAL